MTHGNVKIIRRSSVDLTKETLDKFVENIRTAQAKKQAIESFLEKWDSSRWITVSMEGVSFIVPASPVRTELRNKLLEINEVLKGIVQ